MGAPCGFGEIALLAASKWDGNAHRSASVVAADEGCVFLVIDSKTYREARRRRRTSPDDALILPSLR